MLKYYFHVLANKRGRQPLSIKLSFDVSDETIVSYSTFSQVVIRMVTEPPGSCPQPQIVKMEQHQYQIIISGGSAFISTSVSVSNFVFV